MRSGSYSLRSKEIPVSGIVSMRLSDGSSIEGVIRRMNFGNNAGRGGWRYYGEYELESIDGARWVIDVLDIESACDMEKPPRRL
jgi:hypothetical protein